MDGWQTACLGDVLAVLKNGLNCKQDTSGQGQKVSRIESISLASFDLARVGYAEVGEQDRSKFRLLKGDILFSHINSPVHVGKTAVFDIEDEVYHGVNLLLMRPTPAVVGGYLAYYLKCLFERGYWLSVCKQSVNQASVNQQDISRVPIAFPTDHGEQRRIVAILDEAFDAISTAKANAERNLQNARELFDSKLFELLGQESADRSRRTLREVSIDFGRGKSKHRPRNDPTLYGGPYPFIQTGEVRGAEHLITDYTQTYSEAGLAQSKLWPRGTLCITIAANIAETGVLDFDACFPDSIIGVVVDERQTSSKYLEYMLHTVKATLKAKGKGSAQDNINLATFENERFPFPDLGTQAHIVGSLDELSRWVQHLESLYKRKLATLDELRRSIFHRAFNGGQRLPISTPPNLATL